MGKMCDSPRAHPNRIAGCDGESTPFPHQPSPGLPFPQILVPDTRSLNLKALVSPHHHPQKSPSVRFNLPTSPAQLSPTSPLTSPRKSGATRKSGESNHHRTVPPLPSFFPQPRTNPPTKQNIPQVLLRYSSIPNHVIGSRPTIGNPRQGGHKQSREKRVRAFARLAFRVVVVSHTPHSPIIHPVGACACVRRREGGDVSEGRLSSVVARGR